ncbi:MAG: SMP-30/gluconolactonase/LRE family protein [Chitinophagaceae bacterium]|nr:SMP-30/gluconolactonase/LRE family protein [Chitinophagaceae bacterium]
MKYVSKQIAYLPVLFLIFYATIPVSCKPPQSPSGDTLFQSHVFTPAGGFTHGVEGPSVDKYGNIYAVNFSKQGTIGKITPAGNAEVFITLPDSSVANGSRFDGNGNMILADYVGHNIFSVNMASKQLTVIAHAPQMTQPNDVAVDSKGHIYASDPNFKAGTGRIWRVDGNGAVTLLDTLGPANGIEVSPDEKKLFVGAGRSIWVFDLSPEGTVSNRRLLTQFPDFGTDGMRCDVDGNIYMARIGKGVVAKIAPSGELIREITLTGKNPTNVAFGGKDGRTVYVTLMDQGNLESFRVDKQGREWKAMHRK